MDAPSHDVDPRDKLIHELFEEQVERTPDNLSVICERQTLTYAQLNARANQLASYLKGHGVGPDRLVGICLERSVEMVVGLLGILKAGGAYVPLDPSYPPERLGYMLSDAAPGVLLIQAKLSEHLKSQLQTATEVIALDTQWHRIATHDASNPDNRPAGLNPRHLAYVIYTSGSTGQPKGAMNEHLAVVNRLLWMQEAYRLGQQDRVLQKTPFSFDVSVWEFYWPLLSGAGLVMARPEGHKDPTYLRELIEETGITTLHFVPSMLRIFLDQHHKGQCRSLRHIVCSGEELPAALQRKCFECLPWIRLSNLYGPTEAAVDVTAWECSPEDQRSRVPIGKPIANVRMYVLDAHRQPVPPGVAGELYIGGVGVGRGYLNRPQLTAERFLPDPFSADPQARLYRTGDLGRWLPDGALEYLGRNDHQVKIRGFRIELGEIEAQLARHPQVKDAVVLAREDVPEEKRLVAYVTARAAVPSDPALSAGVLRAYLKPLLPDYMVPSAFVTLESFPLTPNGKLDRRALPAPDANAQTSRPYEPPAGELEQLLAGIWQSILRIGRVGRRDNFFELGGHSLLIVQLRERLRQAGVFAEGHRVFASPTLAELAISLTQERALTTDVLPNLIPPQCEVITPHMLPLVDLQPEHIEQIVRAVPGGAANIQDIYPLAPLQEGLLFHHLLRAKGGDTYVLPILISLASQEKLDALITALEALIDRHDVLRTAVLWNSLPRPVQVVYRRASLPVEEVVCDTNQSPLELLKTRMRPEQQRLDLHQAPLMRLQIARTAHGPERFALFQLHHLLCDHESVETALADVQAYLEGGATTLPSPLPYRNHVAQALAYAKARDSQAYFSRMLGDVLEPTLAFGLSDVHGDGTEIEEAKLVLERDLSRRIRAQARHLGTSPATLFHAAFGLVVSQTSGRSDVVFGTILLGRLQGSAGAQRTMGMFINTLPLKLRLQDRSVLALVEQTHRDLAELLEHEQASLSVAQRCSGIAAGAPLFNALLNYRYGASMDTKLCLAPGITVLEQLEWTNYPINLNVDDLGEGFALVAQTDRRIAPQRLASYVATAMSALTGALEESPSNPALSLSILPLTERRLILEHFNATEATYSCDKLIHELFEEQVERTPHEPAVICERQTLTYAQLNARANQLARYLRELGVGPDRLVGICLERSLEMVIGLLGILKAGGAYVPLDPSYPPERLGYMLSDAAPAVLLIQEKLRQHLPTPKNATQVIALDTDWLRIAALDASNSDSRRAGLHPRHLAYVIYTSGSTGQPKGAMNEHLAVVNRLLWMQETYRLGVGDRVLQKTPFSFDVSVWEFFSPLLSGAGLVMARPEGHKDPAYLRELIEATGVTRLHFVPSMLQIFLDQHRKGECRGLRHILCSGEELPAALQRKCFECLPWIRLSNLYGPTETAVEVTGWDCSPEDQRSRVPIGKPITNVRMYVLDAHRQPVPLGVAGELHIGGMAVGRGYLNRPQLTAERFVPDPFSADPQARLYRTGDLARWLPDGTLEYLGRNDHQVKIRGFRIELGEIEAQLARYPHVKDAVVLAREDVPGEKRLVAYLLSDCPLPMEELRSYLKARLPEHMIPVAFVELDHLPLTPNGKLDRKALPAPDLAACQSDRYATPQGEVEERLAGLWRELLQVERIGRNANFFELGGHSILGIKLAARVEEHFGPQMPILTVFQYPTIREMASLIDGLRSSDATHSGSGIKQPASLTPLQPRSSSDRIPLTFAQQWLWQTAQLDRLPNARDGYGALRFSGPMDYEALRASFRALLQRHESLRARIVRVAGELEQRIGSPDEYDLPIYDLSRLTPEDREAEARRLAAKLILEPWPTIGSPLFVAGLLKLGPQDHRLITAMHHIISDGASMSILTRDLATLYTQLRGGLAEALPPMPIQFPDYAVWQEKTNAAWLEEHGAYWTDRLAGAERLQLFAGETPPHIEVGRKYAVHTFGFGEIPSAAMATFSRHERTTTVMSYLTAFFATLAAWTGKNDIVVSFSSLGRLQREFENVIGCFTAPLFLRIPTREENSLLDLSARVHEEYGAAHAHHDCGRVGARVPPPPFLWNPFFNWIPHDISHDQGALQEDGRLRIERYDLNLPERQDHEWSPEILLALFEGPRETSALIRYRADRVACTAVERFARAFRFVTETLAGVPTTSLRSVRDSLGGLRPLDTPNVERPGARRWGSWASPPEPGSSERVGVG